MNRHYIMTLVVLALVGVTPLTAAAADGQITGLTVAPSATVGSSVNIFIKGTPPACGSIDLDFGDGTPHATLSGPFPLNRPHAYNSAGTFTLKATALQNCKGQASASLTVKPQVGQMVQRGLTNRSDPYRAFRFLVYFGASTTPVAGLSKVSGLSQSSGPIGAEKGRTSLIRKGWGRTEYGPITLERGLTHERDFAQWANAAQALGKGARAQAPRREMRVDLLNEAGQPVQRYFIHGCWVSEYQALPDLDAGASAVAIVRIKLENEGWERDLSLTEPAGH